MSSAAPNNRRFRRARVGSSDASEIQTVDWYYDSQGDTANALEALISNSSESRAGEFSLAVEYNSLLLQQLLGRGNDDKRGSILGTGKSLSTDRLAFLKRLQDMEVKADSMQARHSLSKRQQERNQWIMTFNRALILYSSGDHQGCIDICTSFLSPLIPSDPKLSTRSSPPEISHVSCRMALLLLECLLKKATGRNIGIPTADGSNGFSLSASTIVDWIEHTYSSVDDDPEMKFLLSLYKSRVDLAQLDKQGKHQDSNVRSARKELKSAMEVFQHKLRSSSGEAGSVVSSANSEENAASVGAASDFQQQPPPNPSSTVLQKYNQAALLLKAHLEQLKGNAKKSLILCSEAQMAHRFEQDNPIHANNLAVVYESNGKRHLALHSLTKALRSSAAVSSSQPTFLASYFHSDGTARPDDTLLLLHNCAICALQANRYLTAYECLAACISNNSQVFAVRPRTWLRLAEACVGLASRMRPTVPTNETHDIRAVVLGIDRYVPFPVFLLLLFSFTCT